MRASDLEREAAARRLCQGVSAGRISVDTYARRLDGVYEAKNQQQLHELLRDLRPRPFIARFLSRAVALLSELLCLVEAAWRGPRLPCLALPVNRRFVTVGRAADSDYRVGDASVSRRHAALAQTADGWLLEDRGSFNGTRVNGIRVLGPTPVQRGDIIALGDEGVRLT